MVGTRGNKDDLLCGRIVLGRESRRASKGALEEPQDEIFWDSDEVRDRDKTEDNLDVLHSSVAASTSATAAAHMTKNKKMKGKGSPNKSPVAGALNQSQEKDSGRVSHTKEEQTTGVEDSVSSKAKTIKCSPKVALRRSPDGTPAVTEKTKSSSAKASDKKTVVAKGSKGTKVGTIKCATSKDVGSKTSASVSKSNMNKSSEAVATVTTTSGKTVKKMKKELFVEKEEEDEEDEDDDNSPSDEEVPDKTKKVDEDEEYKCAGTSVLVLEQDQLSEDDMEDGQYSAGLRRSSRHRGYSRQSWLMAPRRLRGYPSPATKEQNQTRFVDSEEPSDDEMVYNIKGRLGRRSRLPQRYQEDTEEEEEISRGPGRPRGYKVRKKFSHLSAVISPRVTRLVTRTKKMSSPRRRNIVLMTDDEEEEDEEEKQQEQSEQKQESGNEESSAPRFKRKVGQSRTAFVAMSVDKEDDNTEEDTEDERTPCKKTKKFSDPILRNEDCVELAKTLDSYNGKKRLRRPVARLNYSSNTNCRAGKSSGSSAASSSTSTSSEDEEDDHLKGYTLRRSSRKPDRSKQHTFGRELRERTGHRRNRGPGYLGSPARKPVVSYKRRTTHNKSSTSSSEGADDEHTFEKRRSKSNAKARGQLMPMNFTEEDLEQATIKERSKVGASLADVEPMAVDRGITFSSVGGLSSHVRSLREMVVLPLLYPEVFDKFSVTPPRGVLFYGPPGTGKTLVARALANECSLGDKKVAFFMRKGADCLSKWVGESERQLRLLFDQAYQMRPSIIFFDEIDGLAPVRSSRQDQIHSSIVSTLLALMDGLDSRGEIIIIGATNRIEAIDPALRRPGRFDRELCFPLPSSKARQQILSVHTKSWEPGPSPRLLQFLAEATTGYCGADLKSLCCEAVLASLRSKYPQVYHSAVKLHLELDNINVRLRHFRVAMNRIVPAGQRSRGSIGARLHPEIKPLLQRTLSTVLTQLAQCFPQGVSPAQCHRRLVHSSISYRPRLLLQGSPGQGQSSHLGRALIHAMERVPAHKLDLAALYSNAIRTPEEAVAQILHEACSRPPSIVFMPRIDRWFETATDSACATFFTLLDDIDPATPVLLLATTQRPLMEVLQQAGELFSAYRGEVFSMQNPSKEERQEFFRPLFYAQVVKHKKTAVRRRVLEALPLAQVAAPRELSEKELQRLVEREEATLRELRIFLRQICTKLARNRQFCIFSQPVDVDDVTDYLDIIAQPMDLETMMTKIDRHEFTCAQDFLKDIDLICANALEYNPNHSAEDQHIRHTACALRDTAYTLIKTEMDSDFEDKCRGIRRSRTDRTTKDSSHLVIPEFVYTQPLPPHNGQSSNGHCSNGSNSSGAHKSLPSSSNPRLTTPGSGKKRRKRNNWAKGCITKPAKKKPLLDKSFMDRSELANEESKDEEDENETEDSVRDVDSTNTMEITVAEKFALDLCNGELSSEDSPVCSIAESGTAVGQTCRTSPSSSCAANRTGLVSPTTRRRTSSSSAAVISKKATVAAASTAGQDEQEDVTVSSSERDEQGSGECDGVVDWSHLDAAYANCVSATEDATVAQLQQLHTAITRLVRTHATTRDKTQLLQETEAEIRKFVQLKAHV